MVDVKKFLLIPVLIFAYVLFINFIAQLSPATSQVSQSMSGGTAQTIGMGDSVAVSVTRPYFFGTVRLPVYSLMFGDISIMHELFSYFIIILTAVFIIQEVRQKKIKRGGKMAKKAAKTDLKAYLMPILWGFVFMIIAGILTGDPSSIVIGLLVMYLEYKLRK